MKKLAIYGHKTRYNDVIRHLEIMGGINNYSFSGCIDYKVYFINDTHNIYNEYPCDIEESDFEILTLEEFEKELAYSIGDKVMCQNEEMVITGYHWDELGVKYELIGRTRKTAYDNDLYPVRNDNNKILIECVKNDNGEIILKPNKGYEIVFDDEFKLIKKKLTRRETIADAAEQYISLTQPLKDNFFQREINKVCIDAFEAGANWADETLINIISEYILHNDIPDKNILINEIKRLINK